MPVKPCDMVKSAHGTYSVAADGSDISSDAFDTILETLKRVRGFNLEIYKNKCIKRRIAIRIRKTGCASAREYGELLLNDAAEPDLLLKVLTIHVSQFFRNPSTFEKLKKEIFPDLFSRCTQEGRDSLTIWSVGCAGGEEPYSIALILREAFALPTAHTRVSILATDVDREVIEAAQSGVYREERLLEVPTETRARWFTQKGGTYRLAQEIRDNLTIWSVGCAGGEEPYSVALILKEAFALAMTHTRVSILATDVDREVIRSAQSGVYREERLLEVPVETRARWFTQEGGTYRLAQEMRDMVTFSQSDLFHFDPAPDCDLILCRNVLIYLERNHQEKILRLFAESLRPGGVLVLGKAETLVGECRRRFQTICPVERIYRTC